MNKQRFMRFTLTAVFITGISMTSGCQSFIPKTTSLNAKKMMFWKKKDEVPDGSNARKMVALWSESVSYGPGQEPNRGLGGRLFFYDEQNKTTKIDGDLVVYAYDDEVEGSKNADDKPDRKYVISAEEFQDHYSESDFGPSYSIWIPWDKAGSSQKSISLVPMFKSTSGQVLVGDHSRALLPGAHQNLRELQEQTTTYQLSARNKKQGKNIQQVSYDERTGAPTKSSVAVSTIKKTSIPLNRSMQQRVINNSWRDKDISYESAAPNHDMLSRQSNTTSSTVQSRADQHSIPTQLIRPRSRIFQAPKEPKQ